MSLTAALHLIEGTTEGYTSEQIFGQRQNCYAYTYDDIITLPGHINFGIEEGTLSYLFYFYSYPFKGLMLIRRISFINTKLRYLCILPVCLSCDSCPCLVL